MFFVKKDYGQPDFAKAASIITENCLEKTKYMTDSLKQSWANS